MSRLRRPASNPDQSYPTAGLGPCVNPRFVQIRANPRVPGRASPGGLRGNWTRVFCTLYANWGGWAERLDRESAARLGARDWRLNLGVDLGRSVRESPRTVVASGRGPRPVGPYTPSYRAAGHRGLPQTCS